MNLNINKTILKSILVNKKEGTKITTKKSEKLQVWIDELKPYLEKLQQMGYIDGFEKSTNTEFTIIKPISQKTINTL